jgi:hypothetical protein
MGPKRDTQWKLPKYEQSHAFHASRYNPIAGIKSEIERMGRWERSKRSIVIVAKNQHSPALHIMPPWMKPTSNTWAKQLSSAIAVMSVHSFRPPHATTYPINLAKHHETSRSNSFSPSAPPLFAMDAGSRADLPVPPKEQFRCPSNIVQRGISPLAMVVELQQQDPVLRGRAAFSTDSKPSPS